MWKFALLMIALSATSFAAVQTITPQESAAAAKLDNSSTMLISPSARALDYQQAFELMRKEKSTGKVYFQLADGTKISNIIDMNLMGNSTLVLFRFNSSDGIRFQVVKIEEIALISYTP